MKSCTSPTPSDERQRVIRTFVSDRYITRPEGRVAYDVAGRGPLLVLVPGMGDLRGSYRFLAPALRQAGYRLGQTAQPS